MRDLEQISIFATEESSNLTIGVTKREWQPGDICSIGIEDDIILSMSGADKMRHGRADFCKNRDNRDVSGELHGKYLVSIK